MYSLKMKIMNTKQNKDKGSFTILKNLVGVFMLSILMMACNDNENKTATLHVRLTDAPADFQEVNIDIQSVQVHNESGEQESGWRTLSMLEAGVYNLLELTNGLDTLLAATEIPAGKISQIRLILGTDNTVMVDGELFPLSTPSAQQSGLKLNVNAQLKAGITYTILLDFDAALSVVEKGDGTYSLKPVIRAISEATSGAIEGTVTPLLATPAIYAIAGSDTVATTFTDEFGNFMLRGVPAGTYNVSFDPKEGYSPLVIEGVIVTVGDVTNMGTVTIL
jgi:hypothetical protein